MIKDDHAASLLAVRGITKAFAGVPRPQGRRPRRASPARCTASSARTAPASRRSSRCSPARTSPTAARSSGRASRSRIPNPVAALDLGIATMYQELDVVDGLTIAENIFLGHELATGGVLHRARARTDARASCSTRLGHGDLSPHREVGTLSAGEQADREHGARPLARQRSSSSWTSRAPCSTPKRSRTCSASSTSSPPQGIAVIYISHRLEEIRADRRPHHRHQGRREHGHAASRSPTRPTPELIRLMTGRDVENVFPPRRAVAGRRARRARGRRPRRSRGIFTDVELHGARRRGRRARRPRRLGPLRDPRDHLRRAQGDGRHRRASTGERCAPGRCARRSTPASGSRPRSARARACCSRSRSIKNVTLVDLRAVRARRRAQRAPRARGDPRADRRARTAARPTPTAPPARSRAATSRRSCSPAGSCTAPRCCCSTSRPAASTSARAPRSTRSSAGSPTPAPRSSWSRARSRRCSASPTACSSSPTAACSTTTPATEIDEHGVLDLVMKGSAA